MFISESLLLNVASEVLIIATAFFLEHVSRSFDDASCLRYERVLFYTMTLNLFIVAILL